MQPHGLPDPGNNILVVMDHDPACLEMLRWAVSRLPHLAHRFFTLLQCCPTIYWEHGGGSYAELRRELESAATAEGKPIQRSKRLFDQARSLLVEAGVPASHIRTTVAIDAASLVNATSAELKRGHYTGVIVDSCHRDIVRRLRGRGLTDRFRGIPRVAVWAVDEHRLATAVAR